MCIAIFPLSLYKSFKNLTFFCMFGVVVTIYITIVISIQPFLGTLKGVSLVDNLQEVKLFKFDGV